MKKLINDAFVKKLQPRPGRQRSEIIWDTKLPSFGICITVGGTKTFVLDYRVQRRHRRGSLGRYPALTVEAARDKAKLWQAQIINGKDPLAAKQEQNGQPTMAELCNEYMEEHALKHKRAGSIRNDKRLLNIVRARFGNYTVAGITQRDISKLHQSMSDRPIEANRLLACLSKAFACAIAWKYVTVNSVVGIKRFDEKRKERWLNAAELQRFSVALDAYPNQSAAD